MEKENRIFGLALIIAILICGIADATEKVVLMGTDFSAWRNSADWTVVGDAFSHPKNENLLSVREGTGVIANGRKAKSPPLVSKREFGDARVHVEFMIPKGSNSGVYIQGQYEIQILDSWTEPNVPYPGGECGGIYQRWDESREVKGYDGHSVIVNACRPPGQWQDFDIVFRAARFDASGKKIANACFVKVFQNGTLIHDNVEVSGPTRGSMSAEDKKTGPILLQGDHGPVAFRNIWVTPIEPEKMGFTNPFFAMDTGTIDEAHKSAKSQAKMLAELGYAGIGFWEREPNISIGAAGLAGMLSETNENGLKVFGAYFTINLEEPNEKYMTLIAESMQLLRNKDSFIWLAITSDVYPKSSPQGDDRALAIITGIADAANKYGVGVALYPHAGFWLERVDDGLRLAEKANRRNVGIVFNLYHQLKTDGPDNMDATIKGAMPYLSVVTINGTSQTGSIETLDRGTFDVYGFLKLLKQDGYKGPIGLQGYGIGGDVRENLSRSINAWRGFSDRLAFEEAQKF
jgi:sugar phosphate isomerase/epimerase